MFVSDLEVLTGNIQWWNLQFCESVGNLHKALPLEKNNNLNPSNSDYLVTGKINSSLQWQTAWDGRWGHVVHCLNKQSLPPICTAFCSFCAVTEQRIVFLQQQERNSRSGKLNLPGIFTDFCPGPAPSLSKYLIPISSVKMSIFSTLPESLETENVPQTTPNVVWVPKSRLPGIYFYFYFLRKWEHHTSPITYISLLLQSHQV